MAAGIVSPAFATDSSKTRISLQIVVSSLSSPPGTKPKPRRSATWQAIHRSSVTRATAAKPIPVVRHTTFSMLATAAMRPIAAASRRKSSSKVYSRPDRSSSRPSRN